MTNTKGRGGRASYTENPVTREERLSWARDAVRVAEVKATAYPHDRALQFALESRRRELAALEAGRAR